MQELLNNLFTAVLTAAIPVVSAMAIYLIRKAAAHLQECTDNEKLEAYIAEIADAVTNAVAATNQTYVDALKNAGAFTQEAQAEALQKAFAACIASISADAQDFIEQLYGDLTEYLTTKIEAEVHSQKLSAGTAVTATLESTTETTAVAASTAAATAATYLQTAIEQLEAEAAEFDYSANTEQAEE